MSWKCGEFFHIYCYTTQVFECTSELHKIGKEKIISNLLLSLEEGICLLPSLLLSCTVEWCVVKRRLFYLLEMAAFQQHHAGIAVLVRCTVKHHRTLWDVVTGVVSLSLDWHFLNRHQGTEYPQDNGIS